MGVDVEVLSPGDGRTYPKTGQTVVVHYTGTLDSGKKFDSSRDRGVPFKFKIGKGEVIKGWDQGVAQMCVGERARLTCSPDFAYGSRGHPGVLILNTDLRICAQQCFGIADVAGKMTKLDRLEKVKVVTSIPPNAVLVFDVELLKVEP